MQQLHYQPFSAPWSMDATKPPAHGLRRLFALHRATQQAADENVSAQLTSETATASALPCSVMTASISRIGQHIKKFSLYPLHEETSSAAHLCDGLGVAVLGVGNYGLHIPHRVLNARVQVVRVPPLALQDQPLHRLQPAKMSLFILSEKLL